MQRKRRILCAVLTAALLPPALTCCVASRTETPPTVRRIRVSPVFPSPYDGDGNPVVTLDGTSGTVSMPLWYWLRIVDFAVDVETDRELENEDIQ